MFLLNSLYVLVAAVLVLFVDHGCSQSSECIVPPYSIPLHEVNVTVETGNLLLTEGRCYLDCLDTVYQDDVTTILEYPSWPFGIVTDDCETQQKIHECTRGCRYLVLNLTDTQRTISNCLVDCSGECRSECGGSINCINPNTMDNWVARSDCMNLTCQRSPCQLGCIASNNTLLSSTSVIPPRPRAPPRLMVLNTRGLLDNPPFRAGVYSIDLTQAMTEPYTPNGVVVLVGFLFKIVDVATSHITYIWQHDPREDLELTSHACRSIKLSFAIVNRYGQSNFSDEIPFEVYGDNVESVLNLSCSRTWNASSFNDLLYFRFNLSWFVSPLVAEGELISNFTLSTKLVSLTPPGASSEEILVEVGPNITTSAVIDETEYSIEIGNDEMFFRPRMEKDRIFKIELNINWNETLAILDSPYLYSCSVNASSPQPTEVRNISLHSFEVLGGRSNRINIVASWSPPAEVNGLLERYSMCVGRLLANNDDEYHECKDNISGTNMNINDEFLTVDTGILFLQMRAWNDFVAGNWSSPIDINVTAPSTTAPSITTPTDASTSAAIDGLTSGELSGVILGAITMAIVLPYCQ